MLLLPVEVGIVCGLLGSLAAPVGGTARSEGKARSSPGDDWTEELLKYDFENGIWDASAVGGHGAANSKQVDDKINANYGTKQKQDRSKNVTLNQTFINKVEHNYHLPIEYSKKVNDYYVDNHWGHGSATGQGTNPEKQREIPRPTLDLSSLGLLPDPEYSLWQSSHNDYLSSNYKNSGNGDSLSKAPSSWDTKHSQAYRYPGVIPAVYELPRAPAGPADSHGQNAQHIREDYGTGSTTNSNTNEIHKNQKRLRPNIYGHAINWDSSQHKQPNTDEKLPQTYISPPKPQSHNKSPHLFKHKKRVKPFFAPGKKRRPWRPARPYKRFHPHPKRKHWRDQHAAGANVVIHLHNPRRPLGFRGPHGLGVPARLSPVAVVCGVLLVGALLVLGYLIWLTPPTIVTYSKRQRADSGADLLAAPFELRRLTELAAQLSQALAEAELVILKLGAAGEGGLERWRSCQPLQLCRALVEGDLLHRQPVWSRCVREGGVSGVWCRRTALLIWLCDWF